MSSARIIRINELLKREIAVDIPRLFANGQFDTGAITVTTRVTVMAMFSFPFSDTKTSAAA